MGPIELQAKISRLHIQRDDALRELAQLRASLTAARADVERLREGLEALADEYDDIRSDGRRGDPTEPATIARSLLAETAPKGPAT